MKFAIDQRINRDPAAVARALADPAYYEQVGARSNLAPPEVLSCTGDGDRVVLRLRYRFVGQLSSAVRAAIDPAKLTWVEESEHDVARCRVTFRMVADHYADRFDASGHFQCTAAGQGVTRRQGEGDLVIRVPLVGRRVEAAIVSGLREHLATEPPILEAFIPAPSPDG